MIIALPGRPTRDGLLWWVAYDEPLPPRGYRPALPGTARELFLPLPSRTTWRTNIAVIAITGLPSESDFELVLGQKTIPARTLPSALRPQSSFTIALGSCFAGRKRPGANMFYEPDVFGPSERVQVRFLCGDQVYMDLPWSPSAPEPGPKYVGQWQELEPFYCQSPTVMHGDDHEFWNDFPHQQLHVLWDPDSPADPLWQELIDAYEQFELAFNLEASTLQGGASALGTIRQQSRSVSFAVDPLEFFALDTRSNRTVHDAPQPHFADPARLDAVVRWLGALQGPGVLVVSEPIVSEEASYAIKALGIKAAATDWHFPGYPSDYGKLLDALHGAQHDVMLLGGDIHWSRLLRLAGNRNGRTIYELISSPLSLIPEQAAPHPSIQTGGTGTISWPSAVSGTGKADWVALAVPPAEFATYATVRFRRPGLTRQLNALVDFWGRRGGDPTQARPLCPTITLPLA